MIHNLVNKLRTTGFSIDKKTKHKCRVLTEEKLDEIGAKLEHKKVKISLLQAVEAHRVVRG
jgi:transposase